MSKVPKGAIGAIGAIGAERCHRCPSFHGKTLLVLHKKLELHSFFIVSRQIDKTREKTIHLYDTPMTPMIIATVSPLPRRSQWSEFEREDKKTTSKCMAKEQLRRQCAPHVK